MKKLLLTLGTVAAIAAPVASVVACGAPKATHQDLDLTKVNDLKPKIKTELVSSLGDAANIDDGVVTTESNGDFDITYTITPPANAALPAGQSKPTVVVTVNAKGDILDTKWPTGMNPSADFKTKVQALLDGATTVQGGDKSVDKLDFDISNLDADIENAMTLAPPAAITATDYDSVLAYNNKVEAFRKAYGEEIAEEALEAISTSKTLTNLSKTEEQIEALGFSDKELVEADVDALGLTGAKAKSLKHLIGLGAKIHITVSAAADVSGVVMGLKDETDGNFGWIRHVPSSGGAGIQFATINPA